MIDKEKIEKAIELAIKYGGIDGDHHKAWVIDQMVSVLAGPKLYKKIVEECIKDGYTWEKGIAP